jgi:RNA polymerase sigma factor (TIGR02999 family)
LYTLWRWGARGAGRRPAASRPLTTVTGRGAVARLSISKHEIPRNRLTKIPDVCLFPRRTITRRGGSPSAPHWRRACNVKSDNEITELLLALRGGDRAVLSDLVPLIYDELRVIARRRLRTERTGHTLTTTALVHEAYLKLVRLDRMHWRSRAHFFAIAAQAMRQVLVNHALRRKRIKRGKGAPHIPLEDASDLPVAEADRVLALNDALAKLASLNPRHARFVECRFFGGMSIEETAMALNVSPATAKRDWKLLRAWLERELNRDG